VLDRYPRPGLVRVQMCIAVSIRHERCGIGPSGMPASFPTPPFPRDLIERWDIAPFGAFRAYFPCAVSRTGERAAFKGGFPLRREKLNIFLAGRGGGCKQGEKAEVAAISAVFESIQYCGAGQRLSCGSEGLSRRVVFPLLNRRIRRGVNGKITDIEQLL
jgi:hypothetical protein